jgi:signal transduction histidine kinase
LIKGDLALYHHNRNRSDSLADKAHAEQLTRNRQEFEAKYNMAKNQAQIAKLNEEKQIQQLTLQKRSGYIIALFLTIAALLIVGILLRNASKRKEKLLASEKELREQQIQTLEKEKQLLSAEALMQGQEAERSRLAKDLHDGLGGILTGTKYSLSNMKQNMIISADNAEAFEKTMNMLDQSITELRRIAHNMMPESLLKLSLDEAVQDYCLQVTQSGALAITYQGVDVENLAINDTVKINVYRIVQELINNAIKHASAKDAIVQLTFKDKVLGIAVEDNGKGLNTDWMSYTDGIGYQNIKSRIDFLKGNMDIQSIPGKGTSILIKILV